MFSRPLLLTLKIPPRQILNRTNTHRMMFINMSARSSTLYSLQVLLKSLSAHLVSVSQGTKLRRFTLPVSIYRKTHKRLKINHHKIMVVTHSCNIKFTRNTQHFLTLNISGRDTATKSMRLGLPLVGTQEAPSPSQNSVHSTEVRPHQETMQPLTVRCFLIC